MQTSRHQTEDGLYGFDLEAAVIEIAAKGYYLFTGSIRLLGASLPRDLQHHKGQSMSDDSRIGSTLSLQ